MILIISPYFAAVILTIIYVHNKKDELGKIESNDDGDDSSANDEIKDIS